MIEQLKRRGYASDPVKAWKQSISEREEEEEEEGSDEESSSTSDQADYNYLLSMQLWSLTREKKDELLKNRDKKVGEIPCALKYTQLYWGEIPCAMKYTQLHWGEIPCAMKYTQLH